MNEPRFRRNRQRLSCTNCRERKKKCDRGSPCSLCVRFKCEDTCRFESKRKLSDAKPLLQVPQHGAYSGDSARSSPEARIGEQVLAKEEVKSVPRGFCVPANVDVAQYSFNLNKALTPTGRFRIHKRGLMPQVTMAELDPMTRAMCQVISANCRVSWADFLKLPTGKPCTMEDVEMLAKKEFGDRSVPHLEQGAPLARILEARQEVSRAGAPIGVFYREGEWTELSLMEQIAATVPSYAVVVQFVDYFFKNVTLYPVLHEGQFRKAVKALWKYSDETKLEGISVELNQQLATVISLLLVLRLLYLTALHLPHTEYSDTILQHPISLDAISLVENVVQVFDYFYDSSWELLQALMLLYVYRFQAPEIDYFDQKSPEMLFSLIVTMSRLLNQKGLAVDADFDGLEPLWASFKAVHRHLLILLNLDSILFYDKPSYVSSADFSPYFPDGAPSGASVFNDFLAVLRPISTVARKLHVLYEKMLPENLELSLPDLLETLCDLEDSIENELGVPSDYLTDLSDAGISKCFKFRLLLNAKCVLFQVYYALGTRLESRMDYELNFECLKKLVAIAHGDFGWLQRGFIASCDKIIGTSALAFLIPTLVCCNRLQSILCKFRIRGLCTLKFAEATDTSLKSLRLTRALETIVNKIRLFEKKIYAFMIELGKYHRGCFSTSKSFKFGSEVAYRSLYNGTTVPFPPEGGLSYPQKILDEIKKLLLFSVSEFELLGDLFNTESNSPICKTEDKDNFEPTHMWQLDKMWDAVDKIHVLLRDLYFHKRFKSEIPNVKNVWEMADIKSDFINQNQFPFTVERFDEFFFSAL